MNEKIKELHNKVLVESENMRWNIEDAEKFAELIIRECIEILDKNNPCPPGTTIMYSLIQDEYFDKGWQVAVETKSNQIKKHFGVEK